MPTNRYLPGTHQLTTNAITKKILLEIPRAFPGSRLWRANAGAGVPYGVIREAVRLLTQGRVQECIAYLTRQRTVTFGIPGQADTSGILAPGGRRLEIEVKNIGDDMRPEQVTFREMVHRTGGIYVVAGGVDEAVERVREAAK